MSGLMTVDFHGASLVMVEKDGQPYVAMRPVVEGIGLDWASQFTKLKSNHRWSVVLITTVAQDGKDRDAACMPLRKFAGWLNSIQPSRVKSALSAPESSGVSAGGRPAA